MLLRPAKPIIEMTTQIGVRGTLVWAALDVKHDQFRAAVKSRQMRWNWETRRWGRVYDVSYARPADFAAELAHVLLTAGFPVDVGDAIAQMVMDASYVPEKRRCIMHVCGGKYDGWFAIGWPRDDDHYRRAYAIFGSRYDPPHVVVPPEQYEALLDFAERYDFYVGEQAREIIERAEARRRAILTIGVPPLPSNKPKAAEEHGIDPELADDDEPL